MDGVYVPMLTAGPPLIKAVQDRDAEDVHLMVREPLASLGDYVAAAPTSSRFTRTPAPTRIACCRRLDRLKPPRPSGSGNRPRRGAQPGHAG